MERENYAGLGSELAEAFEQSAKTGIIRAILGVFARKFFNSRAAVNIKDKFNIDPKHPNFREIIDKAVADAAAKSHIKRDLIKAFLKVPENSQNVIKMILNPRDKVTFNTNMTLGIVEEAKLDRFINLLPEAIQKAKASVYNPAEQEILKSLTGYHTPNFIDWKEWSKSKFHNIELAEPQVFKDQTKKIRTYLTNDKVVRVVGLSGLGKSRLVLEALRPRETHIQELTDKAFYIKADDSPAHDIVSHIKEISNSGIEAIFIIDDCEIEFHDKLAEIVTKTGSQTKLLTIDYDGSGGKFGITKTLKVTPETQAGIVKVMLNQSKYSDAFSDSDLRRAEKFAQGYPEIARLILEAWNAGEGIGDSLSDDTLIKRLLFGRNNPDKEALNYLRAMSVFSHFGYRKDLNRTQRINQDPSKQFKFIAEKLCKSTVDEVFQTCTPFRESGILEIRGQYMRVRPLPLAVRLASEWWESVHYDLAIDVINSVEKYELTESLCRQMEYMSEVSQAKEVVESLCSSKSTFGRAEILGSNTGSRIIRSFAVINPVAVGNALNHAFGTLTTEELEKVSEGRRNIVYTLQDLAWEQETFDIAAWLLLCFSAAENESWANNSTGQFLQLFHLYLSGTKVPAIDRLNVLKKGLQSDDDARKTIAIKGYGSALTVDHFSRSGDTEGRGGIKSRVDWQPSSNSEIINYQKESLRSLTDIAISDNEESKIAIKEIEDKIPQLLIRSKIFDSVLESIIEISENIPGTWNKAMSGIDQVLKWHEEKMPEKIRMKLYETLSKLKPTDLIDQVEHFLNHTEYYGERKKDSKGRLIDEVDFKAHELAKKIVSDNSRWDELIELVCVNNSSHSVILGKNISSEISDPAALIEKAISHIKSVPKEAVDWGFTGGLLITLSENEQDVYLEKIFKNSALNTGIVRLIRVLGASKKRLNWFSQLFINDELSISDLEQLKFSLNKIDEDDLIIFGDKIISHDNSLSPIILDILEFAVGNKKNHKNLDKLFRKILLSGNSIFNQPQSTRWSFTWQRVIVRLLDDYDDDDLAIEITNQIIAYIETSNSYRSSTYELNNILGVIFDKYFAQTWPIFSKKILVNDINSYKLMTLIGENPSAGFDEGGKAGLLFETIPTDKLIEWAKANSPEAPKIIARVLPIFSSEVDKNISDASTEEVKWHPVTSKFIITFSNDRIFLSELTTNMLSFGSVGSRVPYYERRISLFKRLLEHNNNNIQNWSKKNIEMFNRHIYDELESEKEYQLKYGH